jgi:hypothetical protein
VFAAHGGSRHHRTWPRRDRVAGIALLGRDPPQAENDVKLLAAVYAPGAPPAVQSGGRAVAGPAGPAGGARRAARPLGRPPAEVKSAVADALIGRVPWAVALLERVRAGDVPPHDLDAARRQRLLRHASPKVKELAAKR